MSFLGSLDSLLKIRVATVSCLVNYAEQQYVHSINASLCPFFVLSPFAVEWIEPCAPSKSSTSECTIKIMTFI